MWAVLDKKTQIVIGCVPPTATLKEVKKLKKQHDLILMTPANSPARIGDKYMNNKFLSVNEGEK